MGRCKLLGSIAWSRSKVSDLGVRWLGHLGHPGRPRIKLRRAAVAVVMFGQNPEKLQAYTGKIGARKVVECLMQASVG